MHTYFKNINADFTCKHCGYAVSTLRATSGVVNRNHCPYCLYSRHVDLFKAGDRLCACKGLMAPVGLTLKNSRDRFSHKHQGELMLVHYCTDCGHLSINRVAADDNTMKLMAVFDHGSTDHQQVEQFYKEHHIALLKAQDRATLHTRLFGHPAGEIPERIRMS